MTAQAQKIHFYFDFISPFGYVAAMRVGGLAAQSVATSSRAIARDMFVADWAEAEDISHPETLPPSSRAMDSMARRA